MPNQIIKTEMIKVDNEIVHVDLNDILDILPARNEGEYVIIFSGGDAWFNIKLKKSILNKFWKIKEKRGQIDESC